MNTSHLVHFAVIAILAGICGCVSFPIEEATFGNPVLVDSRTPMVRGQVTGINPVVTTYDQTITIDLSLQGNFEKSFDESYETTIHTRNVSFGAFPGTMACEGEIDSCAINGLAVCWNNLLFLGLPTVYGLFIAPFDPQYREQAKSIVGADAFVRSPLLGFSKYRKSQSQVERKTRTAKDLASIRLEDAVLQCSSPRRNSRPGKALVIPKNELPGDQTLKISFTLPETHPLKAQLRDFEGVSFPVECGSNP